MKIEKIEGVGGKYASKLQKAGSVYEKVFEKMQNWG